VCDTGSKPSWFYDATTVFNSFNLPLFLEDDDIVPVYSEVIPDSATFSPSPTIYQPLPSTPDVVIPTDPLSSSPPPASSVTPLDSSTITVSDISTFNSLYKELKDHPHDLVIGSISDGVRTRHQYGLINVCLFSCFLSQIIPKNINMALQDPSWVESMQLELQQFRKLKVWELVDLPPNKYPIGMKWVYKNKPEDRGVVVRNKARLVVQGFAQEEGIDYTDVFAHVARIEAIRIFLAHAAHKNFKVYQMDVKCAFLYGDIDEEIYVCQPPGFEDPDFPDKVYKLDKSLYGLHQAPRIWYETLTQYLLSKGFTRGTIDMTLFKKTIGDDILLV